MLAQTALEGIRQLYLAHCKDQDDFRDVPAPPDGGHDWVMDVLERRETEECNVDEVLDTLIRVIGTLEVPE